MTSKLMGKQWKESSEWSQPKMSAWFTPIYSNSFLPRSAIVSTISLSLYSECCLCSSNSARFHGTACLNQELQWFLQWVFLVVWHLQYDRCASQRQQRAAKMKRGLKIPSYNLLPQCLKRWGKMSICSKKHLLYNCMWIYNYPPNFSIKKKAAFGASKPPYKQ